MATSITPLGTDDYWSKDESVDSHLARKLRSGSSSLVLGAGASHGFNLPKWEELVTGVRNLCGAPAPTTPIRSEDEADRLLVNYYGNDRLKFAFAVRTALYEKATNGPSFLLKSALLQALSAFLTNSLRGKGGAIVTFNFDDILETYLGLLGFVVKSEIEVPAWTSDADMLVYHPHGLLPIASEKQVTPVVFTVSDFDEVVGKSEEAWNQMMRAVWSGTFPLFVGLSGEDMRLRTLLKSVKRIHPATVRDGSLYWGVRPTLRSEDKYDVNRWKEMGIAPRFIDSYDDLPGWILSICQMAADAHGRN